ncbi:MAG: HAD-IIIA family hydrolase [Victivallales bacterium]|nr:HAD-IIIA family hydrolase [Victivallales bacterium]
MPANDQPPRPVAFIDRDGTVIYDMSYLADPAKIAFTPHAAEGLRLLQDNGYLLIMITNQSGIGRGLITIEQFHGVQERMFSLLEAEGVHFTACYHCPHRPEDNCHCRKPNTGMLEQACLDFAVDR